MACIFKIALLFLKSLFKHLFPSFFFFFNYVFIGILFSFAQSPEAELRSLNSEAPFIHLCWLGVHLRVLSPSAGIQAGSLALWSRWMSLLLHLETWLFWRGKKGIQTSYLCQFFQGSALKTFNPKADTTTFLLLSLMSGSQKEMQEPRLDRHTGPVLKREQLNGQITG